MKNICTSQSQSSILALSKTNGRNKTLESYSIDINATKVQIVGKLNTQAVKKLLGIEFPSAEVQIHPGALKHIKKHGHEDILTDYGYLIPDMISNPDYVGQNPKEPNSVELIKVITQTLLLAIKLDPSGYLYVSSFYDLNNAQVKLQKRLDSGRLVKYVV